MNTLMHPTRTLSKEDTGTKVDQKLFRGMIGSLVYLTTSRHDIVLSVCLCARFQSDPRESHLTVVKRIFRYLKGTTNLGLLYKKSLNYKLVGFCDADYADRIERKSTSGNYQFLSENLISRASKRQATIALSIAKAEYISVVSCCTQLLWMKHQLEDYPMSIVQRGENNVQSTGVNERRRRREEHVLDIWSAQHIPDERDGCFVAEIA
jgi:hypothetical protein